MIVLRTLGAIGLAAVDGRELDGLLRQPKRLALLCYLASPSPGAWHRRDTLLAAFWPEFETGQARSALRNALYVIRQELGPDVLRTRGDDEVSLDPALLVNDVALLQRDIDSGALRDAVDRYGGDFLPALFVHDAQGFEKWVDGERHRIRSLVLKAALQLSLDAEAHGDLAAALQAQRWLCETAPDDEAAARRYIALLDQSGDRVQALVVFDRLHARLRDEFGSEPSRETIRLIEEIRSRRTPAAMEEQAAAYPPPIAAAETSPGHRAGVRWRWWAGAAVFVLTLIAASLGRWRAAVGAVPTSLLVLPMENATGDAGNDYVATGLAEDVAARLTALHSFVIHSGARARWPVRPREALATLTPRFGTAVILRTRLTRTGDSLQVTSEVFDAQSGATREIATERFTLGTLRDAGSQLAAAVAGAVFRVPLPEVPRDPSRPVDPEAYRLTLLGWHVLLQRSDAAGARELFLRATQIDPLHARAWSGLSSTWAAATTNGQIPFDEGFALAEAAASRALALDSLQGTAWANLGILHALKARSLAAGEPFFRRAMMVEPANAETYMVHASALRFAWQWDQAHDAIRVARQLDPLSSYYAGLEGNGAMCQDRPADALRWYRVQLALDPRDRSAHLGAGRALARMGRWDEAIAQLRALAVARGDPAFASALLAAHGERGYWEMKHREGAGLLEERQRRARTGFVAPYLLGVAEIGAGHLDRGLALLEDETRNGSRMVYKLPCNPEIDEVRSLPRFQRLLAAAGALPLTATGP